MKTELPVTLVVPAYNRVEKTNNLLHSLAEADFSCETILVDDSSSEDLSVLEKTYKGHIDLRYIKNPSNMGPSYSRNVGIRMATNPYVAFTDNDCRVTSDWLIRLHEYLRDAPSHIAGVGGRTIALGQDLISQYYEYNKILDPWFYNGKWLYIVSANAIFKRDILEKAGGFDEGVKKAGGEDVGLCFKINNLGYDLLYHDEAIIIHDFDTSIRSLCRTFYNYGLGCRVQYEKYYRTTKSVKPIGYAGITVDN